MQTLLSHHWHHLPAGEVLEMAFSRLQACACHTLPVTHNERLVGLLTMANVGEFLRVQTALRAKANSG